MESGELEVGCSMAEPPAQEERLLSSEAVDQSKEESSDQKPQDPNDHSSSSSTLLPNKPLPTKTSVSETPQPSPQPAPSTTLKGRPSLHHPINNPPSDQPPKDLSAEDEKATQIVIKVTAFFRDTAGYILQAMDRTEVSDASPETKLWKMRVWAESCGRKFQQLEKGLQARRVMMGGNVGGGGDGKGEVGRKSGKEEHRVEKKGSKKVLEVVTPPKDHLSTSEVTKSQAIPTSEIKNPNPPLPLNPTLQNPTKNPPNELKQPANPSGSKSKKPKKRRRRRPQNQLPSAPPSAPEQENSPTTPPILTAQTLSGQLVTKAEQPADLPDSQKIKTEAQT